ncbi:MAG: hypothetical protein HY353_01110 [Candidatus Omnitrophica bacterium]|nr:hypothetical protein [Candidatus Omnitrophota bacterium]
MTAQMFSWTGSNRGGLLLWTLGINAVLLLYLVGSFPFIHTVVRVPARSYLDSRALYLAESGIARGLWEFNDNGAGFWRTDEPARTGLPAGPWVQLPDCSGVQGGGTDCRQLTITAFPAGDGSGSAGDFRVIARDPLTSPTPTLFATGFFPNATSPTAKRRIRVDLQWVPTDFGSAGFGYERIYLTGMVSVDSYDSNNGSYGGGSESQGHIGTNDAGGHNPDVLISLDPFYVVNGNAYVPTGSSPQIDAGDLAGSVVTQRPQPKPAIVVDPSLASLSVTTSNITGWSGFSANGSGGFSCGGTCTCYTAVRVKGVYVSGRLEIYDGCQILIDRCAGGTCMSTPGGTLNTDGSGVLMKMNGTAVNKIFLRDGDSSLDGGGIQWTSSIPQADRRPERLQLYGTGAGVGIHLAMKPHADGSPFYGVVYVDTGDVSVAQGSENGGVYNTEYFGAFVAGKLLHIYGNGGKQALVHYDRALRGLKLDGTGRTVTPGQGVCRIRSWHVEN